MILSERFRFRWAKFWMRLAGQNTSGRFAAGLAGCFFPPSLGRIPLAAMNRHGYISPSAAIWHPELRCGAHIFIGERVTILERGGGGPVILEDEVQIYDDTFIQTGQGGSISIGPKTHIQPRCYLSAFLSPIRIGRCVEVASNCSFHPHNHGTEAGQLIYDQPLWTKGGITIEDGAWLGFGVTVLDGVCIGAGAVIGAGSVVTRAIPANAIAIGTPARVVKMRDGSAVNSITG